MTIPSSHNNNTESYATLVKLLMIATFLLGVCTAGLGIVYFRIGDLSKEIRILQIGVEDQSAVLLREGIMKPEDKKLGPILGGLKK